MEIRNLDKNLDWTFGHGLSDYQTQTNAIVEDVATALREWKYDCFFNQSAGIDWHVRLDRNQKTNLDSDLQALILSIFGVIGISSFSSSLVGRNYTANFTIQTIFSTSFTQNFSLP
jgi:hypothetical protein